MGLSESRIFGCPIRKSPGKASEKPFGKGFSQPLQTRTTQPKPKRAVKQFEKPTLNSNAEGFHPRPEDVPAVNFGAPQVDPREPEWAQFLAKKAHEKNVPLKGNFRGAPRQDVPRGAAPPGLAATTPAPQAGDFKLQTSEYLKLLHSGEQKASNDSKKRQAHNGSTTMAASGDGLFSTDQGMARLKNDLAGALDTIIRERGGDVRSKKKQSTKQTIQDRIAKGGSKEGALAIIAHMLDGQDQNEDANQDEEAMTAKDDIGIERQNRDEDLAEPAYWSDDDKAPRAIHRASAHKVGHLQVTTCRPRDYVTQKLGADLDRSVAVLLLHLRRLNDRHRSFEPEAPGRRRFVVGIKEVCRGVRHDRVKCIIVAPDIEEFQSAGGIDERVKDILRVGYEKDVPVIFALSRSRIGRAVGKSLRMSVLAVLDATGVQDLYDSTLELAYQKRIEWLSEQPTMTPPEPPKEEKSKAKGKGKAQEVTTTKDRAWGNKQAEAAKRQEGNTPPGKWLPKRA